MLRFVHYIWLVSDYTKVVFRAESIPTTFETPRNSCEALYLKKVKNFHIFGKLW